MRKPHFIRLPVVTIDVIHIYIFVAILPYGVIIAPDLLSTKITHIYANI